MHRKPRQNPHMLQHNMSICTLFNSVKNEFKLTVVKHNPFFKIIHFSIDGINKQMNSLGKEINSKINFQDCKFNKSLTAFNLHPEM